MEVKYIQRQVFANNFSAINAYQNIGYKIVQQKASTHPEIMNYLPYHTKLLMEMEI
jgi:ribosomal protein S18 acetylase RimI-like enzyme